MSKHYRWKPGRIRVQFKPSQSATVHGGQVAVVGMMEQFGLKRRIRACKGLDPRKDKHKGYDPEVYVLGLLIALSNGGCTIGEVERLNEDEALKRVVGVESFPDESSVGEWLRGVGEEGLEAIREITREFVRWSFEQADVGRYEHCGKVECFFDDTQIEVSGQKIEGAKINYEGKLALGWQTLWVGPFVVDGVLGAGGDVSSQLGGLLEANKGLWDRERAYFYADSGSSSVGYLEEIDRHFGEWSVSYNKWCGVLERQAEGYPEGYWSEVVERKGRKGEVTEEQYAWARHQPEGSTVAWDFAVARSRSRDEMFPRYSFIATRSSMKDARLVFERHRLKGEYERRLSELLTDMDLHHPPCLSLSANRVYYAIAILAYNILQALKLIWLPVEEQSQRVRTLVHKLLLIPVEIKRHARQLVACFYVPLHMMSWWRWFIGQMLPRCALVPDG